MCAGSEERYERSAIGKEAKGIYSSERLHERLVSKYREPRQGAIERSA